MGNVGQATEWLLRVQPGDYYWSVRAIDSGFMVSDWARRLGDLNCDGEVDFGDINPFILALMNGAGYQQQYPDCDRMLADINQDGWVDFNDINPFVDLLVGGSG